MKNATLKILFLFIAANLSAQKFNKQERALIQSGSTATMMKDELKVLKTASSDVDLKDKLLPVLAERMFLSMRDTLNPGIGIAAPQVGINRNLFWVQRFDKVDEPFEFYVNPEIVWRSALLRKGVEGCLSIPEIRGDVYRNYTIQIKYWDKEGKFHQEIVEGFTAVVFQHEYDHIKGILFTDRLKEQEHTEFSKVGDEINLYLKERLRRQ